MSGCISRLLNWLKRAGAFPGPPLGGRSSKVPNPFGHCWFPLILAEGVLLIFSWPVLLASPADLSKLDATLRLIYNRYDVQWKFHAPKDLPGIDPEIDALRRRVEIDLTGREPVVPVAATVRDQGAELTANSFQVEAQIGNLVTLKVPVSRLPFLAGLASVVYVQASTLMDPMGGERNVRPPSQASVPARDIVGAAPNNSRALLENQKVRVIEVWLKPGESIGLYSHNSQVVYALNSSSVRYTSRDGQVTESKLRAGQAVWQDAVTHSLQNVGKTESRFLVVELK